jgi:hypothetical protein
VTGQVVMGGTTLIGNTRYVPKIDAFQQMADLADWYLSPNTGLPWTVTEVDNIISAANADTFGINVFGKLDSQGMRSSAFWVEVTHCLENRMGFLDQRGYIRKGWDRYALGSALALSANTEYFAILGALNGSTFDAFSFSLMNPTLTSDIPSTSPSDNNHDHRQGSGFLDTGPGGIARDGTTQSVYTTNEALAFLFETSGAVINGESQAYSALATKDVYQGATANVGQQLTTPGAGLPAAYSGVQFTVAWQDQCTMPQRPLNIEIRHGAGAISGGGTLDSTASLDPNNMLDGTLRDYFVKLDSSFVPAINTQYVILFKCAGFPGYRFQRHDTRSDDLTAGTGTTLAMIEGATQGGQTDSYVEAGAQLTRYDLPVALIPPPAAPTLTATVVPAAPTNPGAADAESGTTSPPYVLLTWSASALGSSFGWYTVYRRRRMMPTLPWVKVAVIGPRTDGLGATAAQVEANWREFRDYEAAYTPPNVGDCFAVNGWDYAVTTYNTALNLESIVGASPGVALGVIVPPGPDDWQVSNQAPWLNWPLRTQKAAPSDVLAQPKVYPQVAGRDFSIVRVSGQAVGRRYKLGWQFQDRGIGFSDEYPELRGPRAAAGGGRQIAVMRIRGDRNFGVLSEPATTPTAVGVTATADLYVTGNESLQVGFDSPAGLVPDGSSQFLTTPSTGLLNPAGRPFTVFMAAIFPSTAAKSHLSKGNITGGGAGYGFRNSAGGTMRFTASDGGNLVTPSYANWPFDGFLHVAVGTYDGTNLAKLYCDGVEVARDNALPPGAITNAVALVAGADNGGASQFSALAPVQSWGVYMGLLTPSQVLSLSKYLLSHSMVRVPPGPSAFYDVRDQRCWDGQDLTKIRDLSGNGLDAASVGTPIPRGAPFPYSELDAPR